MEPGSAFWALVVERSSTNRTTDMALWKGGRSRKPDSSSNTAASARTGAGIEVRLRVVIVSIDRGYGWLKGEGHKRYKAHKYTTCDTTHPLNVRGSHGLSDLV